MSPTMGWKLVLVRNFWGKKRKKEEKSRRMSLNFKNRHADQQIRQAKITEMERTRGKDHGRETEVHFILLRSTHSWKWRLLVNFTNQKTFLYTCVIWGFDPETTELKQCSPDRSRGTFRLQRSNLCRSSTGKAERTSGIQPLGRTASCHRCHTRKSYQARLLLPGPVINNKAGTSYRGLFQWPKKDSRCTSTRRLQSWPTIMLYSSFWLQKSWAISCTRLASPSDALLPIHA